MYQPTTVFVSAVKLSIRQDFADHQPEKCEASKAARVDFGRLRQVENGQKLPVTGQFRPREAARRGPHSAKKRTSSIYKAGAIHSLLDFNHNPVRQQAPTPLFGYVG